MNDQAEAPCTVDNRFHALSPSALNREEKDAVLKLAMSVLAQRHRRGRTMSSPAATRDYLRLRLRDQQHEVFGALFLDSQHRILKTEELFNGTIDGAAVYPRVVVQRALDLNAAAVLFFHNHPSGIAEPSQADRMITRRLQDALALMDIRVLDHVIVTSGDCASFAEMGLL